VEVTVWANASATAVSPTNVSENPLAIIRQLEWMEVDPEVRTTAQKIASELPDIGGITLPPEVVDYIGGQRRLIGLFRKRHDQDWEQLQKLTKQLELTQKVKDDQAARIMELEEDNKTLREEIGTFHQAVPSKVLTNPIPGMDDGEPKREKEMSEGERAQREAQLAVIQRDQVDEPDEPDENVCPKCGAAMISIDTITVCTAEDCDYKVVETEEADDVLDQFIKVPDETEAALDEFQATLAQLDPDDEMVVKLTGVRPKDDRRSARDQNLWDATYQGLIDATIKMFRKGHPIHHDQCPGRDGEMESVMKRMQIHLCQLVEKEVEDGELELVYNDDGKLTRGKEVLNDLALDTVKWAVNEGIAFDLSDTYQAVLEIIDKRFTPASVHPTHLDYSVETTDGGRIFLPEYLYWAAGDPTKIALVAKQWAAGSGINGAIAG